MKAFNLFTPLACASLASGLFFNNTVLADQLDRVSVSPEVFQLLNEQVHTLADIPTPTGTVSSSITSPSASGGAGTVVSVGTMYVNHWATTDEEDGNLSVALSFGDPYMHVGVLLSMTLDSIGINHSFGKNGGFGVRLNKYFWEQTALAVGISNLGGWEAWSATPSSYYAAVTHNTDFFLPISLNAGFGTGSFYDMDADDDRNIRPFASVGLGVIKDVSLIADYTSQQLSMGVNYSFALWQNFPMYAGMSWINLNEYDNTKIFYRLNLGLSYAF